MPPRLNRSPWKNERELQTFFYNRIGEITKSFGLPKNVVAQVEPSFNEDGYVNKQSAAYDKDRSYIRPDLWVQHADGSVSIFEFKASHRPKSSAAEAIVQLLYYKQFLSDINPALKMNLFAVTPCRSMSMARMILDYSLPVRLVCVTKEVCEEYGVSNG